MYGAPTSSVGILGNSDATDLRAFNLQGPNLSYTSCRPATEFLTTLLAEPTATGTLRSMRGLGKPSAAYVEFFAASAPAEVAETIREQLEQLPTIAVTSMLEAWELADASGKKFEVTSELPESVVEFARRKRIRISIEVDEQCVRVSLAHLVGHHPKGVPSHS